MKALIRPRPAAQPEVEPDSRPPTARRLTSTLGCATKGAENQRMRVPREEVSVHLGSYLGGWRGNLAGRSPGDKGPRKVDRVIVRAVT